jgi:hypothetical protein
MILGIDADFDWHLKKIPGHYYFGYSEGLDINLNSWWARRKFRKRVTILLQQEKLELESLNVHEIVEITEQFWAR